MNKANLPAGVWSAAPTPYLNDGSLDCESIQRLAEHHLKLGIKGLFIGGTCGEGPWLSDKMRLELLQETVKAVKSRMKISFQVSDNSAMRILENIERYKDCGADVMIVAPPYMQMNSSQDYLLKMYTRVLDSSPLPVGFYHRGANSPVLIEAKTVVKLMEHENLVIIKDSSASAEDRTLLVEKAKSMGGNSPLLLNGLEFDCVPYLKAGYHGLLIGGGSFNGAMANEIFKLATAGEYDKAQDMQNRMSKLMFEVFGGKEIKCWLAGQKQMMKELGVFSTSKTIINYQLTGECAEQIKLSLQRERALLLPEG